MSEGYDQMLEEWLGVLAELWTAAGKPLEADRLQVYQQALEEVPLGLLELGVRRVIRENVHHVVPLPGVVWVTVRRTLRVCFARSWGIRGISDWRWRIGWRGDGEGNEGIRTSNDPELSCPAARATAHSFSWILACKSRSNFPHASPVSCSKLLAAVQRATLDGVKDVRGRSWRFFIRE